MANTAISTISAAIIRKGQPVIRWADLAANTYIPGDWGYFSDSDTVTAAASGTAACLLMKPVLIGYEGRLNWSTKARRDIDNDFQDQTTAYASIILAGLNGPLFVAATCEDPTAAKYKTMQFMYSNTAGDIEILDSAVDPTGGAQPIYLAEDLANGDTVGHFIMY